MTRSLAGHPLTALAGVEKAPRLLGVGRCGLGKLDSIERFTVVI